MKVSELIAALEKCPQDALVISGNRVREGEAYPVATAVSVHEDQKLVKILTHNWVQSENIPPIVATGRSGLEDLPTSTPCVALANVVIDTQDSSPVLLAFCGYVERLEKRVDELEKHVLGTSETVVRS